MPMPATNTLLKISGSMGQPLYAARGLTQTLIPLEASSQIERSINGEVMDLSHPQFRKYDSEISCTDVETPAIDGVWPGMEVEVECVAELSYLTSGGSPEREVVSGSSRIEGDYTFYRPVLQMVVVTYDIQLEEYAADYSWILRLTEQ